MEAESQNAVMIWSFTSMLAGGVLILTGAVMSILVPTMWSSAWPMGGMMPQHMGTGWTGSAGALLWMLLWGTVTGTAVLVAAFQEHSGHATSTWGAVAMVAGALSLLAMGGYFVGAIAAIVGGALAVAAKAEPARKRTGR